MRACGGRSTRETQAHPATVRNVTHRYLRGLRDWGYEQAQEAIDGRAEPRRAGMREEYCDD
jgi:hypothetical protein